MAKINQDEIYKEDEAKKFHKYHGKIDQDEIQQKDEA